MVVLTRSATPEYRNRAGHRHLPGTRQKLQFSVKELRITNPTLISYKKLVRASDWFSVGLYCVHDYHSVERKNLIHLHILKYLIEYIRDNLSFFVA